MTDGELIVATVAILFFSTIIGAVIDRWAEGRKAIRRRLDAIRRSRLNQERAPKLPRIADLPPHGADDTQ